ncbi:MAG: hypothetical protein KGS61_14720 [Verrucomicrobia bacterium]|nr:hypothetical protein [Verrucomicrobiota bacterium]
MLKQFAFSYLLAYMFFLSLCLGGLFFVMLHHLFDASWSVTIRRLLEHLAFLMPVMALLYLPLALLAPQIYPWWHPAHVDHSLRAKIAWLNPTTFYLRAALYLAIWSWLAYKLRYWSLQQDKTGAARCTFKMRKFSYVGIFLFAATLTGAAIDWIKSLEHEWYSTMFGVYFFASCAWTTTATVYVITLLLQRAGPLRGLVTPTMYYYIGSVLLAFTVFYAYIHFAQYFIIWNANVPEETFWYVLRERGTWWDIGMVIVFGHFLVPFLALLRIDVKTRFWWMASLGVWAWLMNYADLAFNIMPPLHPDNFVLHPFDLLCLVFIGGVLTQVYRKYLAAHPAYPLRDPRLKEALTQHELRPAEAALPGGIAE